VNSPSPQRTYQGNRQPSARRCPPHQRIPAPRSAQEAGNSFASRFVTREANRIADRIIRAKPKVVISHLGTARIAATVAHGLYKTKVARARCPPRARKS